MTKCPTPIKLTEGMIIRALILNKFHTHNTAKSLGYRISSDAPPYSMIRRICDLGANKIAEIAWSHCISSIKCKRALSDMLKADSLKYKSYTMYFLTIIVQETLLTHNITDLADQLNVPIYVLKAWAFRTRPKPNYAVD